MSVSGTDNNVQIDQNIITLLFCNEFINEIFAFCSINEICLINYEIEKTSFHNLQFKFMSCIVLSTFF